MGNKIEILEEVDLKKIESIAEKYNMTIDELCKELGRKKDTNYFRKHVRYSADEILEIDKRAGKLNLSRNDYIRRCYMKALEDEYYRGMDIKELKKNTYAPECVRDIRVAVYINDMKIYNKLKEQAEKCSLPLSTFIRDISLRVEF